MAPTAQFLAHGLNHESPILLDYVRDRLFAAQLKCTEVSDRALAATLASEEQNSSIND